MVDLEGGIERVPAEQRLKRLKELERQKQEELEKELEKKRKEFKELLEKRKDTKEELEELEQETLDEIAVQQEREINELEARVQQFRESKSVVEESIDNVVAQGAGYGLARELDRIHEGVDYLMNADASSEKRAEVGHDLYKMAQSVKDQLGGSIDEGYVVNKLQEEMTKLKEGSQEDPHSYVARIENVLTDVIKYS